VNQSLHLIIGAGQINRGIQRAMMQQFSIMNVTEISSRDD